ncbi:hypothetical protein F5Y00DRAFT_273403 [Daldinia vernicosa]|uniref:uncharacterized protein n=1 Tax=Daldinia vernicosa TaxID=114800 RepID=UPI0020081D2C|nr:uncharacterized protein F5Y00DRAFT_273403 [Daldinia vernicosa]KAI0845026.1 hypothetical protein F5Y00DRAFT_273403 [Daldinia vernicosa]
MSGFEIAGAVLGALPIAFAAFGKFQEVEDSFHVRREYKECEYKLRCCKAFFKTRLRILLSDLTEDQDRITELLSDPGGHCWHDKNIADVLMHRLGKDSYDLFMDCLKHTRKSLKDFDDELALEADEIQDFLQKPKTRTSRTRLRELATKDNLRFQAYKLKFSSRRSIRSKLFEKLKEYDSQLEGLLEMSEKEPAAVKDQGIASKIDDSALCNFWIQADAFFKALASAWSCNCHDPHMVKLLLEHRTSKEKKFNVLFATQLHSYWDVQKVLMVGGNDNRVQSLPASHTGVTSVTIHEPQHKSSIPIRSVMGENHPNANKKQGRSKAVRMLPPSETHIDFEDPISSLCESLIKGTGSVCGYLSEDDNRYYVHKVSQQTYSFVTIDQILRRETSPLPSRRKRYELSFILASSFLQLVGTPWLPGSWKKSDIVFISNDKNAHKIILNQPHLRRDFMGNVRSRDDQNLHELPSAASTNGRSTKASRSLELLGIILLELCFGQLLENQPHRKDDWPLGENDTQKDLFDVIAAQKWNDEVEEEAGNDFDQAIRWCLEGHHSTPPEKWRHEMLRRVVQPLEKCHKYLSQG